MAVVAVHQPVELVVMVAPVAVPVGEMVLLERARLVKEMTAVTTLTVRAVAVAPERLAVTALGLPVETAETVTPGATAQPMPVVVVLVATDQPLPRGQVEPEAVETAQIQTVSTLMMV